MDMTRTPQLHRTFRWSSRLPARLPTLTQKPRQSRGTPKTRDTLEVVHSFRRRDGFALRRAWAILAGRGAQLAGRGAQLAGCAANGDNVTAH
jgi:hypothetical protein